MLDEEEVQSIIEVMSEDEDDVIEADDDITGDVAADVSPKKRRGVHIHGPDHPRGERTKKFFSELRSLSLSRRRFEAEAQVQALETGVFCAAHSPRVVQPQITSMHHAATSDSCRSSVSSLQ